MKYLKNKYTIILSVLLILIIVLVAINKDAIVSKYFGSNQASVASSRNSQFINSGSGLASGSGSMSGSGTGSGVLAEVYYPDLNLYSIEVVNTQQLNQLYSRTRFINPEDRNSFYTLSSRALARGGKLNFYFDPQNIAGESVGYYNGKYLNNEFIDKGLTCATKATIKKNKATAPTAVVSRIAKWYGICAILSAAHSLVYGLGAPLPKGFPKATTTATTTHGTTTKSMEVWNLPYLDKITEKIPPAEIVGDRGLPNINMDVIYNQYFPVEGTAFGLSYWHEIMRFWKMAKKDCTLYTPGHASFISNIFEKDGKKYIEITDTLSQGSAGNSNILTKPGTTRFVVTKDNCLKVDYHSPEVRDTVKAFWEQECEDMCQYNKTAIRVRCIYPTK